MGKLRLRGQLRLEGRWHTGCLKPNLLQGGLAHDWPAAIDGLSSPAAVVWWFSHLGKSEADQYTRSYIISCMLRFSYGKCMNMQDLVTLQQSHLICDTLEPTLPTLPTSSADHRPVPPLPVALSVLHALKPRAARAEHRHSVVRSTTEAPTL